MTPANLNRPPAARVPVLQAAYAAYVAGGDPRAQILALTGATAARRSPRVSHSDGPRNSGSRAVLASPPYPRVA